MQQQPSSSLNLNPADVSQPENPNMLPKMAEEHQFLHLSLYREADLVNALMRSLHLAKDEYRIRVGLTHSLKLLELDPSSVLMCILPVKKKSDSLSHLQLMLIEAFCNENGIRLLEVLSPDELLHLVKPTPETDNEDDEEAEDCTAGNDTSLIVIQTSHHDHVEDDELQKIYDRACLHYNARPIVRLPS